jgi:general secretion pathway protein C
METLIKRHFWAVNLLGLALIAWQLGGVVNGLIAMKLGTMAGTESAAGDGAPGGTDSKLAQRLAKARAGEGAGGAMAARSPFLLDEPVPEPEPQEEATDEAAEETPAEGPVEASYELTKLPVKLLGTMVVHPMEFSSATMEVNRQDHKMVTVGYELLEGQARVEEIHRTYVVLKEAGKLTIAPLWPHAEGQGGQGTAQAAPGVAPGATANNRAQRPGGPIAPTTTAAANPQGVKKISDTSYQLDRSMINDKLKNLGSLGQQARVVPNYRGGKYDGFRMIGMANSSMFRDIGFENGDIIKVINGNRIDSPNKALALYEALKNKARLTVQVERGGMLKTMRYTVK